MKKSLMDIIVCPECKGDLKLRIDIEDEKEILEGALDCEDCLESFPIEKSIPNLLPPKMRDSV